MQKAPARVVKEGAVEMAKLQHAPTLHSYVRIVVLIIIITLTIIMYVYLYL